MKKKKNIGLYILLITALSLLYSCSDFNMWEAAGLLTPGIKVNIVGISAGQITGLLDEDNTLYMWGSSNYGAIGLGEADPEANYPVESVAVNQDESIGTIKSIECGFDACYVLNQEDSVFSWGSNEVNQLGNNTKSESYSPIRVMGIDGAGWLTDVKKIVAGSGLFSAKIYAIKQDGTLVAWGDTYLGNGSMYGSAYPVLINLNNVVDVVTGYYCSVAVLADGNIYSWGTDHLAASTAAREAIDPVGWPQCELPVQVEGVDGVGFLTDAIAVAAGEEHVLVLKQNGTVYAWGKNNRGQLGDGSSTNQYYPVQVVGEGGNGFLTGIIGIAAGAEHSCALHGDDTVYTWGLNDKGQLGNGTTSNSKYPVQVKGVNGEGSLYKIISIDAAGNYSMALDEDGTSYAWGFHGFGEDNIDNEYNLLSITPVDPFSVF